MPRLLTWNDVLDDEEAKQAPCHTCRGTGLDRYEDDCPDCDGFGVQY